MGACQFEDTDKLPTKHQEGQGWIAFKRVWSELVGLLKFAQLRICVLIFKVRNQSAAPAAPVPKTSFQLLPDMHWKSSRCQGAILLSKIRSLSWQVHDWQTLREVRLFHEVTVIRYTRKSIGNIVQIVACSCGRFNVWTCNMKASYTLTPANPDTNIWFTLHHQSRIFRFICQTIRWSHMHAIIGH